MDRLLSRIPVRKITYFAQEDLAPGDALVRFEAPGEVPGWLVCREPRVVLSANRFEDVPAVLQQASNGGFAVGFVSYEAAPAFDPALQVKQSTFPLLAQFAVYDSVDFARELPPRQAAIEDGSDDWDFAAYEKAFWKVKQALAEGTSYQVNLTYRRHFKGSAAYDLFCSRCGVAPPPYSAFIQGDEFAICSFSPELFFRLCDGHLTSEPMKGTAPFDSLGSNAEDLRTRPKTRAENLMIVDMVRNDFGRIAGSGTVSVPELMAVQRHGDLFQMVSRVCAETDASVLEVFRALFPAASVTGAPKVETCRLIAEFESSPRNVYCGAVGFMVEGFAQFSVAIRTALIQGAGGEYGIGGGVVWDSEAADEYAEAQSKASVLQNSALSWALVEAFAPGADVEPHLLRMRASSTGLGVPAPIAFPGTNGQGPKVRILCDRNGNIQAEQGASRVPEGLLKVTWARDPVASQDPNFRHKTTSRPREGPPPYLDEILYFNEFGHATEFRWGSLVVEIGGRRFTPPPEDGCLPGITVQGIETRSLTRAEVEGADHIWFANAVVGFREVLLQSSGDVLTSEQSG